VIHGAAPKAVALSRERDGFAIGTLDAAGGVQVIRTTAAGAIRTRVTVANDQPALAIASTSQGLLILRADQVIELAGPDGTVITKLVSEPGAHIESLLVRGPHALALLLEGKRHHTRRIVLDHGVRWGETTPGFDTKIASAVLSPDGNLLAVAHPRSLHPELVDLSTGKLLKVALCVPKGWPNEDGDNGELENELIRAGNVPVPLGFLTDTEIVCGVMGSLAWWHTDGKQLMSASSNLQLGASPVVVVDQAMIAGSGADLAIARPTSIAFLGYSLHDVARMAVGAGSVLVVAPDQETLLLDTGLRERARLSLGRGRANQTDVVLLDDRYALTATAAGPGGHIQLAVIDGVTGSATQVLPYQPSDRELSYEPSTRLLATRDGAAPLLVRYDPAAHAFGPPIQVSPATPPSRIALLDPALASGVAALQIDAVADGLQIGELYAEDLKPGMTIAPRASYRVTGELRAADRAGRLYLHGAADHDDVVVYTRGKAGARLPGVAGLTLFPDRDGSRIAAFQSPRLMMLNNRGAVRWDTAAWNAGAIGWAAGGELYVQLSSGLVKVDVETGSLVIRRCGWGFGLSDNATNAGPGEPGDSASICER